MWIRSVLSLALAAVLTAAPIAMATEHESAPVAAAAHGGGHGDAAVNPLAWESDLAIFSVAVFLILMAILWKFAWGPITEALDSREKQVADHIAAAERANAEAKTLLAQHQAKLAAAEGEVREILEKGRREAEALGRELLDKTRQEAHDEKQRALHEIDLATANAVRELAERSADLAVELAGKVVQTKIGPADHGRLVEQAISGFSSLEPGKN